MSGASLAAPDRLHRRARLAVATVFLVNGVLIGSWVARIPAVQRGLGLGEGALGIALLSAAVGALLAMPVSGWLSTRVCSRGVTAAGALCLCASLPCLALAPSMAALMLALLFFGASNGAMDVAMNAQAVEVERRYGRPIMSGFHGLWSVGGILGAALGGFLASRGVATVPHFLGVALPLALLALAGSRGLLGSAASEGEGAPAFARPTGALVGLGVVAFCAMLGEGAVADWSAVYLQNSLGVDEGRAAAGFGAFALAMAGGRLSGDWLSARFGRVALLRFGGLLAGGGLGVGLLLARPLPVLVGFVCAGLGFSVVVPIALSAAGGIGSMPPGPAIAAVTTVGYTGFLVGPPAIGLLAEATSLRLALGVVVLLSFVYAVLASAAGPAEGVGAELAEVGAASGRSESGG